MNESYVRGWTEGREELSDTLADILYFGATFPDVDEMAQALILVLEREVARVPDDTGEVTSV